MRPGNDVRVHLCREAVDFRKQMRGLSVLVQEELELDPFSAHLFAALPGFVWVARERNRVREGR